MNINKNSFLFDDISSLDGVGPKLKKYLENKKIEKIKDLLWDLPYSFTDRSQITDLSKLEIGKISTVKVTVLKYNFPRIRNLPNKVICGDEKNKINIIFFNSKEGYIRKILPLKKNVVISGKINYYKKSYQITNPTYVKPLNQIDEVIKIFPKYSLTSGLTEKIYRKLIAKVLSKMDNFTDWYNQDFLKKNNFLNLRETFLNLHNPEKEIDIYSNDYKRLVYDEILANLIALISARKAIKIRKKNNKTFNNKYSSLILKKFPFELTNDQQKTLKELNADIKSKNRMFRLLQGDVGSGKTILALVAAANVIESKYQVAFMAPTEILATQHYDLAMNLFSSLNIKISIITSKTENKDKKQIINNLKNGHVDLIIGTHALFQKKIEFKKLGFIIIDEQHKFGVRQRIALAKKGGDDCDVLVMSATPIPRTMMMTIYGDMDVTLIREKPKNRKEIKTYSKLESKVHEVINFAKKEIASGGQIFWVCPLIERSKKLDHQSAVEKYKYLQKYFNKRVGLIHGSMEKNDKNKVLNDFLNKKIDVLVSTTVIEVGIDFPKANVIIIDNANKYGLSQLHQLRGRVGRGDKKSFCILLFKSHLSENAKKRINILKSSNDGFDISEQDMKLRGYGDILGFKQSGIKKFKLADPILHKDLFEMAEQEVKRIENNNSEFRDYYKLLKLYDKVSIINDII